MRTFDIGVHVLCLMVCFIVRCMVVLCVWNRFVNLGCDTFTIFSINLQYDYGCVACCGIYYDFFTKNGLFRR